MLNIKRYIPFLTAIVFALSSSISHAAIEKVPLKGDLFNRAKGEAEIEDAGPGQKEIRLELSGLRPNETYTVWLVNEEPRMDMTGLGTGDYSFRSDAAGKARYKATVPDSELKKWDKIEVAYHPTGEARDMENIGIALKGDIGER